MNYHYNTSKNHKSSNEDDQLLMPSYADSFCQLSKQIDSFDKSKNQSL